MARGDQARKAAHRQAVAAQAAEESAYQRKIVQLTAENRELREKLAAQERSAKQTERRLRAERDEGVAPKVEALGAALRAATESRDQARREAQKTIDRWKRATTRMMAHLMSDGLSFDDAYEAMARMGFEEGEWPEDIPFPIDGNEDKLLAAAIDRDPEALKRYRALHQGKGYATGTVGPLIGGHA